MSRSSVPKARLRPGFSIRPLLTCATIGLASVTTSSLADDDFQRRQDEGLAATCAACHGTAGRALPGSAIPGLAGAPATNLSEQLLAFRSGRRPGTVMPQLMLGYTDAQIERLARYFASQPLAAR